MSANPGPLAATAVALVVAIVLLFTVVLPAEYGFDPLGTGEWLGLTGLAGETAQTIVEEAHPFKRDQRTFTLAPWESVEIKYQVAAGSTLLFAWSASGNVAYDFHGEPEGGPAGFAESLARGNAESQSGTAILPFTGIHGWYFENRTFAEVAVTLEVSGYFSKALLYSGGFVEEIDFAAPE